MYAHIYIYINIEREIGSMYGIFTYIYHKTQPHVANRKYTTHGAYGIIHVYIYIYIFFGVPLQDTTRTHRDDLLFFHCHLSFGGGRY